MPMQVFEFQADSTVSLASTAAINRKSCDHCFLNRKTCDKVRTATNSGDKCKRCAKDDRPCTFTPTVHLYHIADCVGRHQCRAKVIQAMGGRKKEVKFKTIEIPIVCDMDSELDQALYEYIQKQPNLLVYNNRIKSFLAQDMLGLSEEEEDRMSTSNDRGVPELTSDSPTHGSKRSLEPEEGSSNDVPGSNSTASPTQGPHKFRIMALIDAHQNQTQQQQQQQSQGAEGTARQTPGKSPRVTPIDMSLLNARPTSPNSLSPHDALMTHQRRLSDTLAASALPSLSMMNQLANFQGQPSLQQQQQQHPYSQQNAYPQTSMFSQQQQQQQMMQNGYRSTSPMPHSPLGQSPTRHSPQPPSPLELSLSINTNFGNLSGSHQNLPSLFDSSLTMSTQPEDQQMPTRTSVGTSTSPQMGLDGVLSSNSAPPPPLVITTTNEDGNEVGFYYAVPSVNLNPAYSDADLFQDFTMMDALGEDFVWIENLFDDPSPEEAAANMAAMSVAAAAGSSTTGSNTTGLDLSGVEGSAMSDINVLMNTTNDVSMASVEQTFGLAADASSQQQQQQSWMSQSYSPPMQG
ncbi:hypothetical protein BGZ80_010260 [Entomortierella chlamydospora]|uniref:Zn(2)-C6 fungal-type domain-containing protein n=1 Tax=Entomortierella chlamydospora TaxID=101097 RepID=A0A9P6MVX7_9FUNG|nr:hypothetical protein BGZ79_008080 [Entomortierella chlamydospora]KAG0014729.1 hypothetical protein BGZ80_010260 [Entomortierella chlamydospora]